MGMFKKTTLFGVLSVGLQFGGIVQASSGIPVVLVIGHETGIIKVNDPKFDVSTYKMSDVSHYGWYSRLRLPVNMLWTTEE